MVFKTTTRSRNSILPYICMAKEHANVGMECMAMKSMHCTPRAITFPPAYKNFERQVMQYISRSTETQTNFAEGPNTMLSFWIYVMHLNVSATLGETVKFNLKDVSSVFQDDGIYLQDTGSSNIC